MAGVWLGRLSFSILPSSAALLRALLQILVANIAGACFLWWRLPSLAKASLHELGLRWPAARDWGIFGAAAGIIVLAELATGLVRALMHTRASEGFYPGTSGLASYLALHGNAVPFMIFFAFIIVFVLPFAEELFLRGLMFRALRLRMAWLSAALIVALISGHGSAVFWVLLIFVALDVVVSWAYERTGNLVVTMLVHGVSNLVLLLIAAIPILAGGR